MMSEWESYFRFQGFGGFLLLFSLPGFLSSHFLVLFLFLSCVQFFSDEHFFLLISFFLLQTFLHLKKASIHSNYFFFLCSFLSSFLLVIFHFLLSVSFLLLSCSFILLPMAKNKLRLSSSCFFFSFIHFLLFKLSFLFLLSLLSSLILLILRSTVWFTSESYSLVCLVRRRDK